MNNEGPCKPPPPARFMCIPISPHHFHKKKQHPALPKTWTGRQVNDVLQHWNTGQRGRGEIQ